MIRRWSFSLFNYFACERTLWRAVKRKINWELWFTDFYKGKIVFSDMFPYLIAPSSLKLKVKRKVVSGFSYPLSCVWVPMPLYTLTKGFFNILGCVGSSQHNGMPLFVSPVSTYSGDDCDTTCKPSSLAITFSAVDLPLDISPTAVVTGHWPRRFNQHITYYSELKWR